MNPVLRADLRYRLSSPRAVSVHTVLLALIAGLTFLSLPPELGRLDDLRQEGLLVPFLVVTTVLVGYFASACACGEITVEGEKSVWDLAASAFPAGTIAAGKVATSAAFALTQFMLAAPFLIAIAGIRGESPAQLLRAAVVAIPAASALGGLGALWSAGLDSDFARGLAHWVTLLAAFVGAAALPEPWDLISPVRTVIAASRDGLTPPVWAAIAAYLLMTAVSGGMVQRRIERIRRDARAT